MPEQARHPSWALGRRPRLRAILVSAACLVAGSVLFLTMFGLTLETAGEAGLDALAGFLLVDLVVGLVACVAAGPVHRSTVGNGLLIAAGVVSSFAIPAWAVAGVRLGERRSLRTDAVVVIGTTLGSMAMLLWHDATLGVPTDNRLLGAGLIAVLATAIVLWGRVRGTRAALVVASRQQAESAELARRALADNREAELARARAEERSALARDMHDGVSHRLSIVAMHAGALASRDDLTPEQIRAATRTIRDAAADAGELLRDSLTALRAPAADGSTQPLPTAASIEDLLAQARAHGADVTLTWRDVSPAELEQRPGAAVALARITEEILMNARKHAPGLPVAMRIGREGGAITLDARNQLAGHVSEPALGTGHGLTGVAERASLLGGSASAGRTPDGAFVVEVRLPWA